MTDHISREHRSWNMSRIKSKNTKPELAVRSALHRMGFRFRIHRRDLPGRPDIVLPKYRTIIFVHGCFWHRHPGCPRAYLVKNSEKWEKKLQDNIRRDRRHTETLLQLGWQVLVIWECQVSKPEIIARIADEIRAPKADE